MNITTSVSSIDWKSNNKGVWKAVLKDMEAGGTPVFSEGYTATVTGKKITISNSTRPSGMVTYASDLTNAVAGGVLYGAGNVSDSLEAVAGEKTIRMGSYTFTGNESWLSNDPSGYPHLLGCNMPADFKSNGNAIIADYIITPRLVSWRDVTEYAAGTQLTKLYVNDPRFTTEDMGTHMAGKTIYYELATPTTSPETAQSLTLQTGVNNLVLNERGSSFTLDYTGTEFTLPLDSTHKYAFSDNGMKSIITGSSEQAVTGGQDMLVDVTRMFNGGTTAINAITSWEDMAAVMPVYNSTVAYNEGEVVGRSGGVTATSGSSATFSGLHGVGTARDMQDVVTGEKTVKIGVVDMGTLAWSTNGQRFYAPVSGIKSYSGSTTVVAKILCAKYITTALNSPLPKRIFEDDSNRVSVYDPAYTGKTAAVFTTAMSGVMLYYELATPASTPEAPQPLTAVNGLNNVHEQNMSITGTPLTMGYTGTDQTITTETSSKYLTRINSVDSVVDNIESIDVRGGRDRVIDLTYMFGAGGEPATPDDFYKLFPTWRGYAIPYNKGSLVNFKGTGLKSVGFNQWDGTYSITGRQLLSGGSTTVNASFSITDYIRIIPGQTYRLNCYGYSSSICWYKYNKTYISGVQYGASNTWIEQSFTAPLNAYWCRFTVFDSSKNQTCFHLEWSGRRNGDYEPYWDFTRHLPTLTYFPDGMNGVGQVYDEITSRQAIKRLTEVNLEDLNWTEGAGTWTTTLAGVKSNTTAIAVPNSYSYSLSGTSLTITSDVSPTGKLVYELSSPVTTTFPEEAAVTAQVSDYGTESVVPVNGYELITAPFFGIVKYQDNYARTITKLPENYQSQDSMDALQLTLGQLLNVTITSKFNTTDQAYNYTVTGDGVPGLIAAALTALAPVTGLTFLGNSYTPTEGVVALPDPRVQSITTIPASTSSYTLTEGNFEQAPNATPTFVLPEVTDTSVVHTIKLTIKTKTGVTSVNFKDSGNQVVTPETIDGTVEAGDLVEYTCTYESLLNKWVVYPRITAKA